VDQTQLFREDLYYRLNVIMLETPPLRERLGDVEELVQVFFDRFNEKQKRELKGVSQDALQVLLSHTWPGNIRELENVMERVVTLESGVEVSVSTLPAEIVHAARKAAGLPKELILRADFSMGPVDLEKVVSEVRAFFEREALLFAKSDAAKASALFSK
jgi:transcriptional regulator with PAS, ATPase and Fis domain